MTISMATRPRLRTQASTKDPRSPDSALCKPSTPFHFSSVLTIAFFKLGSVFYHMTFILCRLSSQMEANSIDESIVTSVATALPRKSRVKSAVVHIISKNRLICSFFERKTSFKTIQFSSFASTLSGFCQSLNRSFASIIKEYYRAVLVLHNPLFKDTLAKDIVFIPLHSIFLTKLYNNMKISTRTHNL